MNKSRSTEEWREVYTSKVPYFHFPIKVIWRNKFLLYLMVRQRMVEKYKQTILGPAWLVIQPLLSTVVFFLVFNRILHLPIGNTPPILFYMLGTIIWLFFSTSFQGIAGFLNSYSGILTKVNIPKLIIPLSHIILATITGFLQLLLFLLTYMYYASTQEVSPSWPYIFLLPFLYLLLAVFSMGIGCICSCLSVKYRDLVNLYNYFIQFFMYITPVIYPLHTILDDKKRLLLQINPLSGIFEFARYGFFGEGYISWSMLLYSALCSIGVFLIGIFFLSRMEKVYADIVMPPA